MKAYWETQVKYYDSIRPKNGFFAKCEKRIISDYIKLADNSYFMLELGAGTGRHTSSLAKKGYTVVAIDTAKTLIKVARMRLQFKENVSLVLADAESLPFKPKSFRIIVSVQTFDYLLNIDKALKEAGHVLFDSGRILITLLNGISPYLVVTRKIKKWRRYGVLRLLTPYDIKTLFARNGFEVIDMSFYQILPVEDKSSIKLPQFVIKMLSIVDYILGRMPFIKYVATSLFIYVSKLST